VRTRRDAADGLAVSLLAAAALSPLPAALWSWARATGAAAPPHRPALTLRLTTLVPGELASLFALLTRDEGLRTERRRAELRTGSAELGTRPRVRRPRSAEPGSAATSTAATAAPAPRAILIAELLRRRRSGFVRTGRGRRGRVVSGFARGFVPGGVRRLVIGAL